MSIKCFYHAGDLDGWCSGAIVRHFYNKQNIEVEMFPINYGDKFPFGSLSVVDIVYMADFSLPVEQMRRIDQFVQKFYWFDHHIGAIKIYDVEKYLFILGERDINFSGCELVWKGLYPNIEIPRFIKLLGLYDCWDHSEEIESWNNIENFQYGFKLNATDPGEDFAFWENWISTFLDPAIGSHVRNEFIFNKMSDGRVIRQYIESRYETILKNHSFIKEWESYKCLMVNSDPYIANYMTRSTPFAGCDIAVNFTNWKGQKWVVSLRTTRADIDLSVLAKKYGGGGHSQASGFNRKELPF